VIFLSFVNEIKTPVYYKIKISFINDFGY